MVRNTLLTIYATFHSNSRSNLHLLTFIVLYLVTTLAHSVEVFGHELSGMIEDDGTGVYQVLVLKLSERFGLDSPVISISPMKRARADFEKNKDACRIDGDEIFSEWAIYSNPLGVYRLHLMTLRSQPLVHSIAELGPRTTLGGLLGLKPAYQNTAIAHFKIEEVLHERQNIDKLKLERIDAILGFVPDYNKYLDQLHFDSKLVLLEGYDRLYCHNTDKAREYLRNFNLALDRMKADGSYKQIMGTFYLGE